MAEQIKFKGIVLKTVDYNEKDKLVTIFSLELGKITAKLRGVKQEKAKLKFAAMPFCFAEFVVTNVNGFLTITEAYQIESFYNIISNYNKSIAGFFMLETTCIIMQKNPDEQWFLTLIKFLKELEFGNTNENLIILKFILITLEKNGYALTFDFCTGCGMKFVGDVFLNLDTGEIECSACSNLGSVKLSKQQFSILKLINNSTFSSLKTIKQKDEVLKQIISIMLKNLNFRLGCKIKSISF